jgi:TonB family protein
VSASLFTVLAMVVTVLLPGAIRAQSGLVRGVVRDEQGAPVASAEVQWLPNGPVVRTRDDGTYLLSGAPSGGLSLRLRRLGYLPAQRDVTVVAGGTVSLDWTLVRAPQQMAVLNVNARREPSDGRLAGFRERLAAKRGGHFITRERIEQSGNRSLYDAFRGIPGVRFLGSARGNTARQIRFRSNGCPPVVFIDGFAAAAADFDFDSIDLNMVEGIEMYASSSSVPPALLAPRGLEQCGVVAIWSRPAQPRVPRARSTEERRALLLKELAAGTVLTAEQVDEQATLTNGELDVIYPEALWRTGVDGTATVEFVIDERGRLDWGTLIVVSATNPAFGQAVVESLVPAKWAAAVKAEKVVAQLIVLTIEFTHTPGGMSHSR